MSSRNALPPDEPGDARVFRYPSAPVEKAADAGDDASRKQRWNASVGANPEVNAASIEQKEREMRQRGMEEGKAAARMEFERSLVKARGEIGQALREFVAERDSYFHRAEEQVVRLALAIARKILHRESQIDPLLLAGIMRVALERIGANSSIKLRANPADIRAWRDYFAQSGENFPTPELIGDAALEPGRCILETEMGTTEIGLETQLKEIEQGFMDLLAQRPGSRG
jgi:flagellar assembly protein FliH